MIFNIILIDRQNRFRWIFKSRTGQRLDFRTESRKIPYRNSL